MSAARVERRELARLRATVGAGRAVAERTRVWLQLDAVARGLVRNDHGMRLLTDELVGTQEAVGRLDAELRRLYEVADRDARRIDVLEAELAMRRAEQPAEADRQRDLWTAREILTTSAWVERLPPSNTLVSVIMPTRNRPRLLREAIASVLRQSHEHFELLVIDDGSGPETAAVLDDFDDPRIRWFRREQNGGGGAARNIGLERARGDYVAYVDDDNLIGHLWLRGLIWAFQSRPDCDVVYGAMVHDDVDALDGLPSFMLRRWDRQRQLLGNTVDQGMVAHRTGLPGVAYDEQLSEAGDWDFVVRLTADRDPVRVPVVAVHYRTRHAGRISDNGQMRSASLLTQQRFARRGPLRVLVLDDPGAAAGGSPAAAATALDRLGEHVVRIVGDDAADLQAAIRSQRPDVVLLAADPAREAQLEQWFTAYATFAPGGVDGETPGPGPTTSLGRWDGRTPFGVEDGGPPLRAALLDRLDQMHGAWLGMPVPEALPGDARFPVTVTRDVPGLVTVVRDPYAASVAPR